MSKQGSSFRESLQNIFAVSAILIAFVVSKLLFDNVMGNPVNFEAGNPAGHALEGNYLGIIYKGGFIVPILMTCVLSLIIFVIERLITLSRAKGKGRLNVFVRKLQNLLAEDKIEEALEACDKQKGSLANVMKAGLARYRDLQKDKELEKDQKILSIQKSFEEATALELPMLSKNMVIFSTLASISVLIGLIGTVLGMIRAFAALAQSGAPDALALSQGISEALVNTAFGITGSTLSIIAFNFFSSNIDGYTYKIDEAGFSLTQNFAASLKNA
ncbi:MAG TPA: MotA/TolQ/ExbB proton channel family protein [Bacteroidales bacterium]|jgi:biopolymer transport protein ExbB|nr:MotA/TolQ/ExbB proton channel family protein [Bacteroidales bacterium]OQB65553.1 MAG: Biopolymer transport protein ExbB [Bacteroidetes bacterium ADurb.Bin145]HOU01093.1 MotA/TolQ/ExbB proton channel family protein [Bacteroidales bacterium]HQG62495.1 MotA/TolQ/ExbB proton channel family protein [Bacteroidales bacterium]HQK68370.1 MotA/TolQ/ExbB proton channel family protein [Bacteroidales bacterium]